MMLLPVFCSGPGQGSPNRLESRFLSCRAERGCDTGELSIITAAPQQLLRKRRDFCPLEHLRLDAASFRNPPRPSHLKTKGFSVSSSPIRRVFVSEGLQRRSWPPVHFEEKSLVLPSPSLDRLQKGSSPRDREMLV